MDITKIDNVSDLIEANENAKTPFEKAVEALTQCDYGDSRKIYLWLIDNAIKFHKEEAVIAAKEGEGMKAIQWADDVGRLEIALEALKSVN